MKQREKHHLADRQVYRFVRAERIAHWLNASTFFILAATGTVMLLRYPLGISPRVIRYLHDSHLGVGLLYFFGPAAVLLIGNPRVGRRWVIEALRWSRHDLLWLLGPLRRLFFPRGAPLRVGRFNAGQRMNIMIQIGGKWGLFATGLVMHFRHGVIIMYALHLLFAVFLLSIVTGHIYMGLINRSTRPALSAMLSGYVDAEWLKHHHLGWFEELVRQKNATQPPPSPPEAEAPPAPPEHGEDRSPEDQP